jgi:hypothetical protein
MVMRKEQHEKVIRALCDHESQCGVVVIKGAGGTGKTVLARQVCYDERTQRAFPGGIFWIRVGDASSFDSYRASQQLLEQVTERASPALGHLNLLLAEELSRVGSPCLLVLDDLWDQDHYLSIAGALPANVRVLATCRGTLIEGEHIGVERLTPSESVELLTGKNAVATDITDLLLTVASAVGYWALLLSLARGHLAKVLETKDTAEVKLEVSQLLDDLLDDPTVLDDPASRERSLDHAIQRSRAACGEGAELFDALAVFPADAAITLDVIALLWQQAPTRVKVICRTLQSRGLLEFHEVPALQGSSVEIHDLVVAWLHATRGRPGTEALRPLHERCCELPVDLNTLTPGRVNWLHFHLVMCGQFETLLQLAAKSTFLLFCRLTGSDVAFFSGTRFAAAACLAAAADSRAAKCWLALRWCESVAVGLIRNTPIESIRADALLGNPLRALYSAFELDDFHARYAIPDIIACSTYDDDLIARAITHTESMTAYWRDRTRFGIAIEIQKASPSNVGTLRQSIAIASTAGREADDARRAIANRFLASAGFEEDTFAEVEAIVQTIEEPYVRGVVIADVIEARSSVATGSEAPSIESLVTVAQAFPEGWGKYDLLSKAAGYLGDINPDRASALLEQSYLALAHHEQAALEIERMATDFRHITLTPSAVDRIIRAFEELRDPHAMAAAATHIGSGTTGGIRAHLARALRIAGECPDELRREVYLTRVAQAWEQALPGDDAVVDVYCRLSADLHQGQLLATMLDTLMRTKAGKADLGAAIIALSERASAQSTADSVLVSAIEEISTAPENYNYVKEVQACLLDAISGESHRARAQVSILKCDLYFGMGYEAGVANASDPNPRVGDELISVSCG